MEFYKTTLGRKYYEVDVPRLVAAMEKIAKNLEDFNTRDKKTLKVEKKKVVEESDDLKIIKEIKEILIERFKNEKAGI